MLVALYPPLNRLPNQIPSRHVPGEVVVQRVVCRLSEWVSGRGLREGGVCHSEHHSNGGNSEDTIAGAYKMEYLLVASLQSHLKKSVG